MRHASRVAAFAAALLAAPAAWAVPTVGIGTNESDPVPDTVVPLDLFSWLAGATVSFNGGAFVDTWTAGGGTWGGGPDCGGVVVAGFHLGGCGDTFVGDWVLTNTGNQLLTDFTVDLLPIRHMFDRTDPSPGSVDSAAGLDFAFRASNPATEGTIGVLYSRPGVQVPRDLYGVMAVDLTGLLDVSGARLGGLIPDGELRFGQDTDPPPVPLPAGLWLLMGATGGLAGLKRLRRSG